MFKRAVASVQFLLPAANAISSKTIMKTRFMRFFVLALLLALSLCARAEIDIVLKNDFIKKYMNRVTIETQFTVDKAHPKPNPASKEGDLHIAGRAPEIQLATVAEIMNAKSDKTALNAIHAAEGTSQPIPISGAWRMRGRRVFRPHAIVSRLPQAGWSAVRVSEGRFRPDSGTA